jgi:hypothetical protein
MAKICNLCTLGCFSKRNGRQSYFKRFGKVQTCLNKKKGGVTISSLKFRIHTFAAGVKLA